MEVPEFMESKVFMESEDLTLPEGAGQVSD
jgi:hypothetical protein